MKLLATQRCIKCGKDKLLAAFYFRKGSKGHPWPGRFTACRVCCNEYTRERNREQGLVGIIRSRLATWRAKDPQSDLDREFLLKLWQEQEGTCYYTGVKLLDKINKKTMCWNSASLDRLDPKGGYRRGNVVWCTCLINTMKQDMTEYEFYFQATIILRHRNLL